jgi:hypothetical protein
MITLRMKMPFMDRIGITSLRSPAEATPRSTHVISLSFIVENTEKIGKPELDKIEG